MRGNSAKNAPLPVLDAHVSSLILSGLKAEFDSGKVVAAFNALSHCLRQREAVPEWAAEHLLRSFSRWYGNVVATLDEAVGFQPTTLAQARASRRRQTDMLSVYIAVMDAKDSGAQLNDPTFSAIGKKLNKSRATVIRRWKESQVAMATPEHLREATAALLGPYVVRDQVSTSRKRLRVTRRKP